MCLVYNRCIIIEVTASRKKRFLLFLTSLSLGVFSKNTITISKSDNTFSSTYNLKVFAEHTFNTTVGNYIQQWI